MGNILACHLYQSVKTHLDANKCYQSMFPIFFLVLARQQLADTRLCHLFHRRRLRRY